MVERPEPGVRWRLYRCRPPDLPVQGSEPAAEHASGAPGQA